jgi:hypothetical protein
MSQDDIISLLSSLFSVACLPSLRSIDITFTDVSTRPEQALLPHFIYPSGDDSNKRKRLLPPHLQPPILSADIASGLKRLTLCFDASKNVVIAHGAAFKCVFTDTVHDGTLDISANGYKVDF